MRTSLIRISTTLVMFAAAACGPAASGQNGPDTVDARPGWDADQTFPDGSTETGRCTKVDVLFVIDDSGSMGQEQQNLIANFPMFITVLDASGLDYRVAVTTTSRNYEYKGAFGITSSTGGPPGGQMLQPSTCGMTKRWIDKGDANPSTTFSCLANVGTNGNSDEMPLAAMRDAFEDRMADGTNTGFRRSDALLGVVFLTDEEDCSYEAQASFGFTGVLCHDQLEPAPNYAMFLDQYTGHRSRWAAAAIAGPGPGTCSSTFGNADEASRLKSFVQTAGAQARMSSICDGDLSASLAEVLDLFESACGDIIY